MWEFWETTYRARVGPSQKSHTTGPNEFARGGWLEEDLADLAGRNARKAPGARERSRHKKRATPWEVGAARRCGEAIVRDAYLSPNHKV
jgi:hypothetical protein